MVDCHGQFPPLVDSAGQSACWFDRTRQGLAAVNMGCRRGFSGADYTTLSAQLPFDSERRRSKFSGCRLQRRHSQDIGKSRLQPAGLMSWPCASLPRLRLANDAHGLNLPARAEHQAERPRGRSARSVEPCIGDDEQESGVRSWQRSSGRQTDRRWWQVVM